MARIKDSIRARLILGATLVLVAFVVAAGWAVQRAHADSVRTARLASLQGTVYLLLAGAELDAALQLAAGFDHKIIVERGIQGREFECAVLGNEEPAAATPCEILPSREFYDYEDKYELNLAKIELPANLPEHEIAQMRRLAVACYKAVGCEGMGRVDFLRETTTGKFYINEINTIPGFTSISMYPKMWAYSGIPFADLLDRLIELALERHQQKKATRFAR